MKKVRMALIYDFDKTLSPKDMQEFHYLQKLGYHDPNDFWKECGELSSSSNCDGILAYMYLMAKKDPDLTKNELIREGKYVKLYPGVETWFKRINEYGKQHNVIIEHYVISSGIEEIIRGTKIAKEFKKIYACSFVYDRKGRPLWPNRVVNYTQKTQYLFRINKGVLDARNDVDLNSSTPDDRKYIKLSNMIYFGDGSTDVPSMKVVQQNGGNTIAVFGDTDRMKALAYELYHDKRASFVVKADYSKDSRIEKIVMGIIDAVEAKNKLEDYKQL